MVVKHVLFRSVSGPLQSGDEESAELGLQARKIAKPKSFTWGTTSTLELRGRLSDARFLGSVEFEDVAELLSLLVRVAASARFFSAAH